MAVSGVMKPALVHAFDGDEMALGADHRNRNRHAHGVGLFNHRLDEFTAFRRTQLGHSPPSGASIKLCLTCYARQLTAKKRVGE